MERETMICQAVDLLLIVKGCHRGSTGIYANVDSLRLAEEVNDLEISCEPFGSRHSIKIVKGVYLSWQLTPLTILNSEKDPETQW
jgi:hypothetical protein